MASSIKDFPFPMIKEEKYTSEHFEAWQDGDFADDHCSLCRAWSEDQRLDEERYQLARATASHRFEDSDHCLDCGAEIYESPSYYKECKKTF